jgi:hypothetical protein
LESAQGTIVNLDPEGEILARGLERHAAKLGERLREIEEQIQHLENERVIATETRENLRRAVESLRAGRSSNSPVLPALRSTATRSGFPAGFPAFNAIVHVLSRSGPLHRNEIVARLTDLGFHWGGKNPRRIVGTTLGHNRRIFEEVAPNTFRLRAADQRQDEDSR